jgi:hypothetical protein
MPQQTFITPSGNIACAYRGDFTLYCYVLSSRTLAWVNRSGRGRDAGVKRGAAKPEYLMDVNGPLLEYGDSWQAPGGGVTCQSSETELRCANDFSTDTGFIASRDSVATFAESRSRTAASPNMTTFPGSYFRIDYPSAWRIEQAEEKVSYGYDTTIRDPTAPSTTYLRVDYTPNAKISSAWEGASPQRTAGSRRPGYREIAFEKTTLAGYDAVRWEFETLIGNTLVHKVDIFVLDGHGIGIAILTQAPASEYGSWEPTFKQMYSSFTLR